jgi:hypothetical protein
MRVVMVIMVDLKKILLVCQMEDQHLLVDLLRRLNHPMADLHHRLNIHMVDHVVVMVTNMDIAIVMNMVIITVTAAVAQVAAALKNTLANQQLLVSYRFIPFLILRYPYL